MPKEEINFCLAAVQDTERLCKKEVNGFCELIDWLVAIHYDWKRDLPQDRHFLFRDSEKNIEALDKFKQVLLPGKLRVYEGSCNDVWLGAGSTDAGIVEDKGLKEITIEILNAFRGRILAGTLVHYKKRREMMCKEIQEEFEKLRT